MSEAEQLARFGLGMPRDGTVALAPPSPRWAEAFAFERARLAPALGACELHHVGSTSIPGIHAKPILDLLLCAPHEPSLDGLRPALEALGYEWRGERGIPDRRYCVLYDAARERSFVHLHGFVATHPEVERHLRFRDFLRAHPEEARSYEETKLRLLRAGAPRAEYTEAKAPWITALLARARAAPGGKPD